MNCFHFPLALVTLPEKETYTFTAQAVDAWQTALSAQLTLEWLHCSSVFNAHRRKDFIPVENYNI